MTVSGRREQNADYISRVKPVGRDKEEVSDIWTAPLKRPEELIDLYFRSDYPWDNISRIRVMAALCYTNGYYAAMRALSSAARDRGFI